MIGKLFLICCAGLSACNQPNSQMQVKNLKASQTPASAKSNDSVKTQTGTAANIQVSEANHVVNKSSRMENKMTEESKPAISLRAKAEKTGDKLIVEYEVENHTKETLYLWDRMVDYDDKGQFINENLAYVFFEEPKAVNIIRASLPLPKNLRVAVKETPFLRAIEAKSKIGGKINLNTPVEEFSPYYGRPKEEKPEIKECSEIRLILGWSEFREGMEIKEVNLRGEKVLTISGSWGKPYQRIMEKRIPLSVNVSVHKTNFERQMPLQ